jgi:hypothetical protein
MATIEEELGQAEQAREALGALTTIAEAIGVLSKARDLARSVQTVAPHSSEEALNNSRHEVVVSFNDLIRSLQQGLSAPDKIERARRAVDDWMKELNAFEA